MPRRRRIGFTDSAYRIGVDPLADRLLIAELVREHERYARILDGMPPYPALVEANDRALRFLNNPYQLPPDAIRATVDRSDPRVRPQRLAFVWSRAESSLQVSIAVDDRGRHGLIAVVDGAPVHGELGRHGSLLYSCNQLFRGRGAKLLDQNEVLEPLRFMEGLPGMTVSGSGRLPLAAGDGKITRDSYRMLRRRYGYQTMLVELHHDVERLLADETELFPHLRYVGEYIDSLDPARQSRALDQLRAPLRVSPQVPDRKLLELLLKVRPA